MLSDYQKYRFYEMVPGILVWGTLLASIILTFVKPMAMIYFIILFDIYWVLKVINYSFYLIVAWTRFRRAKQVDWRQKLVGLSGLEEKRHVVFLTLFNETWDVVKTAVQSVCDSVYDKSKFVIVVAGEEKKKDNYELILGKIKQEFGDCFGEIIGTLHPANLLGEISGKGSNLNYSEREIKKYIDARGWQYQDVICTIFDIDTVCHPQFFSYLTYLYCTHPRPTHSSFQPIALYNNNMWESPAILRIMAFGTTFWIMTSLARQDALVTFSSHCMSFQAIVDAGYHDKRIVSEDSRIFYQCLLANDGDYEVTPMYIPVSMDTVRDDKWWQSMKNLYRQQRRWAWGVEQTPFLLSELFKKTRKKFPLWKKIKWIFLELEGKWSWCMVALIITILGRLPMWVAPESVRQSALFFNAPYMLETLMMIAMTGMLLSALLSLPLLPPKPKKYQSYNYAIMLLQWILLPISLVFVSAIPAIDAVTHLMFGKYLGFNISQKKRS